MKRILEIASSNIEVEVTEAGSVKIGGTELQEWFKTHLRDANDGEYFQKFRAMVSITIIEAVEVLAVNGEKVIEKGVATNGENEGN